MAFGPWSVAPTFDATDRKRALESPGMEVSTGSRDGAIQRGLGCATVESVIGVRVARQTGATPSPDLRNHHAWAVIQGM